MGPTTAAAVLFVAAAVGGHLWADAAGRSTARALLKVAASAGMLVVAAPGGLHGRFAQLIFAGLVLSAAGDVLLLSAARRSFLAGVVAFLVAHIAYSVAFAPASRPSPVLAVALVAVAAAVVRWLWPHLGAMRVPVIAYAAVISAMLLLALGVQSSLVRWGALLFYLSDLTVARDRFVAPGLGNRVVGLPLYYCGQVLLGIAAAAPRYWP